ncbi:hypothetical protein RA280_29700 [Cupriavidus sp. CV2]|uniref:hypothetical protein n=1 Tax=Cupriavidus ulmosensis TaxID=3065913 RepID=UPI00296B52E1|nr:hypothetical protein [Cupriavidus sp. CV2]MDW3685840.1 hypothetical protein [Cupriavidus sp. CV2]
MLSKLNALRKDVRTLSRRASLMASKGALPGGPAYYEHLARFFDDLIASAAGEPQIIGLAAAVELGVADRHHLDLCGSAVLSSDRVELRVLYWALSRRMATFGRESMCDGEPQRGTCTLAAPARVSGNPCHACNALLREPRSSGGHKDMQPLALPVRRRLGYQAVSEVQPYRCVVCGVTWRRSRSTREPFVSWSIRSSPDRAAR